VLGPQAPDSELRHKPVVLLARNPCDIAVSWYFQFTKRQSARKQELINHFIEHPIDRHTISMWDFVRHSDIGLPSLIDFLNTWERNIKGLERSLIVRYEDLRAEPAKTLRQVTELMGETFSEGEIEEAVSFASFENLRQLESKGFFRQGGLPPGRTHAAQSQRPRKLQGAPWQGRRLPRLLHPRAGGGAGGADVVPALAQLWLHLDQAAADRPSRGVRMARSNPGHLAAPDLGDPRGTRVRPGVRPEFAIRCCAL
jgi:hypothetical protein